MLNGVKVVTSLWMTKPERGSVDEPCGGGWKKRVWRTVQVPRDDYLLANGVLIVHPATLPILRQALQR